MLKPSIAVTPAPEKPANQSKLCQAPLFFYGISCFLVNSHLFSGRKAVKSLGFREDSFSLFPDIHRTSHALVGWYVFV
jgi:hypothetical protein